MVYTLVLSVLIGALTILLLLPWESAEMGFDQAEAFLSGSHRTDDGAPRWTDHVARVLRLRPDADSQLARDLMLTGSSISLTDLYVYKVLAVLGCLALGGLIFVAGEDLIAAVIGLGALAAWGLPNARVTGEAKRIRRGIERRLPAFLQALAMMTEAGMNLMPAMSAYADQDRTELGLELRLALGEIELGAPMSEALMRMALRCQIDDLFRSVSMLVQAGERGASGLTDTCRELASEAWMKRKDAARELGQQASTKMFAPLMLLVLPTLFLFLIGPAAWGMYRDFQ
jgi:tight adherence protein C